MKGRTLSVRAAHSHAAQTRVRYSPGTVGSPHIFGIPEPDARNDTRWYDPTTGRFNQPDLAAKETNPYLYAAGNPSNATDPTGNWPSKESWGCNMGMGLLSADVGLAVAAAGAATGVEIAVGLGITAAAPSFVTAYRKEQGE